MSAGKENKVFTLGQVLSVTTGRLLAENLISDVYVIVDYLTGEKHWTHQLGRACEVCKPEIFKQHPELKKVDMSDFEKENWQEWLAAQREVYGNSFELKPMTPGQYKSIDPIKEAVEMVGEEKLMVLELQGEQ